MTSFWRLAERLKAPMVHAMRGKEHVEWDNPYDVGMTGLIGFSSGYYAMLDCDVLLMLGTDFPYRQFYPQGTERASRKSISRPEQIGRRGAGRSRRRRRRSRDARGAAAAARSRRRDRAHLDAGAASTTRKARKGLDELAVGTPGKRPDPSAASRQGDQRPRRRRRDLHLRCRPADGVGGALSGDERQAAAASARSGTARWPMRWRRRSAPRRRFPAGR